MTNEEPKACWNCLHNDVMMDKYPCDMCKPDYNGDPSNYEFDDDYAEK